MIGRFAFLLGAMLVHQTACLPPPPYFKTCARSDPKVNECIKKNGQLALPSLLKGDRKYKIPELNPFVIPELRIASGDSIKIKLADAKITGLDNTVVKNANFNFKDHKISMQFKVPKLVLRSNYEISGRILVLPISGKGPSSLILDIVTAALSAFPFATSCFMQKMFSDDLDFTYSFDYNLVKKGKVDYMKPRKGSITYTIKGMKINFENLFNGDKFLGPETNNFLNENWRDVDKELGPGIAEALAEVINLIISNVSDMVPYEELFPEKV